MNNCVVFDIDGTLSDCSHRVHFIKNTPKDYDSFLSYENVIKDKAINEIVQLHDILAENCHVIYITGRPERDRIVTEDWLRLNTKNPNGIELYMRKLNDYRQDTEVKSDIIDDLISKGYNITLAIDDRTSVVKMWRSKGIKCLQCAEGDY